MILQTTPPLHLTYCLNIHPGETWSENFKAIRTHAVAVRDRMTPSGPFGLGLRLGHRAARELSHSAAQAELLDFIQSQQLYILTINGFPYGDFHGDRVKEKVYQPDWRSIERRDYTLLLIQLLTDLQTPGSTSSISTVPVSFKPWISASTDIETVIDRLSDCILKMAEAYDRHGKEIHLGLEPEPGCFLESTEEFLRFYKDGLLRMGQTVLAKKLKCKTQLAEEMIRRHVGVCFDTCHLAIQFEDLSQSLREYRDVGVRISKVQLSAAPEIRTGRRFREMAEPFCEPVYLHQVRVQGHDGTLRRWNDLTEALAALTPSPSGERCRIHFHVPLFFQGTEELQTTAACLTPDFFRELKNGLSEHLEIETYTFDVLPKSLRNLDVTANIEREYDWVLQQLQLPKQNVTTEAAF